MNIMLFYSIALFFGISVVEGDFESIDIPSPLYDCLSKSSSSVNIRQVKGDTITGFCLNEFKWYNAPKYWKLERDQSAIDYVAELNTRRTRREAVRNKRRIRKEYRMLTREERKRFHDAVIALKNDKTVYPNRYEAISNVHSPDNAASAHRGASFLAWHRMYLLKYEDALMEMDETVSLPYWDCTLDEPLKNPEHSVIFSEEFVGNGNGLVKTGPFKNWTHPNFGHLIRNTGVNGNLMSKQQLRNVLKETNMSNIIYQSRNDLERIHNMIHVFVGGHMGELESASQDPLFFMVHAFIDYVWWLFRNHQQENGIDPSTDYPKDQPKNQRPSSPMDGLAGYVNIDGFLNKWTDEVYTYEESPTCDTVDKDCGSEYLKCRKDLKQCVSETAKSLKRRRRASDVTTPCNKVLLLEDDYKDEEEMSSCANLETSVQNIFSMNGRLNMKDWAYLPIKVIYERRHNEHFSSFPVDRKGNLLTKSDIYDVGLNYLAKLIGDGEVGKSKSCHESGSGASKVFVQATGLSYDGSTFDYSIVDERFALSSSYTYVPFRKPNKEPSDVYLTAYDSCGRLCKPYCRRSGLFEPCSGAVRIDSQSSHMYGTSLYKAMLNKWQNPTSVDEIMRSDDKDINVVFFCDRTEKWPWEAVDK